MKCKYCKNNNIISKGIVKNKQRYYCKDCNKTFRLGKDKRHGVKGRELKFSKNMKEEFLRRLNIIKERLKAKNNEEAKKLQKELSDRERSKKKYVQTTHKRIKKNRINVLIPIYIKRAVKKLREKKISKNVIYKELKNKYQIPSISYLYKYKY